MSDIWDARWEAEKKLKAIKTHLKNYPDEKDSKYSFGVKISSISPNGHHSQFNTVYFLTDLETWHKNLKEILEVEG